MSDEVSDAPEDTPQGYGHPPKQSRFADGQSGNSKGRPRGRESIQTVAARLFDMKIPVRMGETTTKMPFLKALVQHHKAKALQGDAKSMRAMSLIMEQLGYFNETPERVPGALVLDDLQFNEDEWVWMVERYKRRKAAQEQRVRDSQNPSKVS